MQYKVMFCENESEVAAQRDQAERAGPYWGAWNAYIGALYDAGVVLRGGALPCGHLRGCRSAHHAASA